MELTAHVLQIINLSCPTAPNPPTDLMVTQTSATSVTVSWTPPADTTGVTGYRISYDDGTGEQFMDITGSEMTTATIPNLTTGSRYNITIVATSDGPPSEEVGPEMVELGT